MGAPSLRAQSVTTATLRGEIDTGDGVPVAGAEVVLVHGATGVRRTALTDARGRYRFSQVPPGGPYTLVVRSLGFADATAEGLRLRLGETRTLDLRLSEEPLELDELRVDVARDPVLSTSHTGPVTLIGTETVRSLPTVSRDFLDFAVLSPLVRKTEEGFSIGGQNDRYNNILVDGILNKDVFGLTPSGVPGGGANAKVLPLDAVQEYQVLAAPFDVRFSGFTGGILNAVTRRGTNEWHATQHLYVRGDELTGDLVDGSVRVPSSGVEKTVLGFTLGGPIRRDRIHLFVAGEYEDRSGTPPGFHVGHTDPFRIRLAPDSVRRMAEILAERYDMEAGPAGVHRLGNTIRNLFGRLDWQLSDGHELTLRHNFSGADRDRPPNRTSFDEYELGSNAVHQGATSHSTALQLLSDLGPRTSNELLVSWQRLEDDSDARSRAPQVEVELQSEVGGSVVRRPVRAGAQFFAQVNGLEQTILQVTDNLTTTRGDHELTLGVSAERFDMRHRFQPGAFGDYRFESLWHLENNLPSRYQVSVLSENARPGVELEVLQVAGYLQDEWSVSDRLTLQLGLRLDVPLLPDAPAANPAILETFGVRTDQVPSSQLLLSPRLGFTWRAPRGPGTRVHGGAGLFAGRPPFVWLSNAYGDDGLRAVTLTCEGANAPPLAPGAPPPDRCLDGSGPADAAPSVVLLDEGFRFPQDLKLYAGVDQRLPWGFTASVGFLFSRTLNQVFLQDLNIGDRIEEPRPEDGYSAGFGGRYHYGLPTEEGFEPRRVSDAFTQVIRLGNQSRDQAYAVTLELRGRPTDWLDVQGGYSYGRSYDRQTLTLTDAVSNFGLTPIRADPNDPGLTYGSFDRPHKVTLALRALPRGEDGGTSVTLFYSGQSGRTYSMVYDADVNGDGYPGPGLATDHRNDLVWVPDVPSLLPSVGFITPLAWESMVERIDCLREARGRTLRRNDCREPWAHRLDLRIAQEARLGPVDLELSLDLVNVMNLLDSAWGGVERARPTFSLLRLAGREPPAPGEDPTLTPLRVAYGGGLIPLAGGGFRAASPFVLASPDSQWRAQVGVRLGF